MIKPASKSAVELFMQGSIAYSKMEHQGIKIDVDYLEFALAGTDEDIKRLEAQLKEDEVFKIWKKRFGAKTVIGSKKQLETIVFEECKLAKRTGRLTDSGAYKSDEFAFEWVDHPFVRKYFECEKLKKARGTYLLGIKNELCGDGYIHPFHNLHTATTYRPSSDRPNVKNIPVRNEMMGRIIRSCYIAPKGFQILEIDLSGAEVAWSCVSHKDPVMIHYVEDPKSDMHRDIASQVYMIKNAPKEYWKEGIGKLVRYSAKNKMVFPEFYGSYFLDCAQNLWEAIDLMKLKSPEGISLKKHLKSKGIKELGDIASLKGQSGRIETEEGTFVHHVKEVEKDMWENRFKVYKQWKWDFWTKYCERGYCRTKTGFVISGLIDRKQVCNGGIQGDAYHHVLWSLIQLQNWLEQEKMKSRIFNEIYDSILLYVKTSEIPDVLQKAKQIMTLDVRDHWSCINVPITIDAELAPEGKSWADKKKVDIPT